MNRKKKKTMKKIFQNPIFHNITFFLLFFNIAKKIEELELNEKELDIEKEGFKNEPSCFVLILIKLKLMNSMNKI